ncbi:MAG: hypothetical protein IPN49_13560 [Saprospiraceae bacterium]|nr:hypothetical protein [Saprospiraceae bacterium]
MILLMVLFPLLLNSQEVVTNIKFKGKYEATQIENKVGFTDLDGDFFMFTESETLSIYKWENELWALIGSLPSPLGRNILHYVQAPNNSRFFIKNGLYYRIFQDYLQVIDIKNSNIVSEHDLRPHGIKFHNPMGIYGTHYFFYTNYGRTQTYYHYDLVGDELEILDIPKSDELYIMRDNIIAGTTSQNNAYFFDAKINSDTLFNLTHRVGKLINYSIPDSTFIYKYVNEDVIIKINKNQEITEYNCWPDSFLLYNKLYVYGNKLITVLSQFENNTRQDSVTIYNLETCQVEYGFNTEPLGQYINNIKFHESEKMPENIIIIGFEGYDPGDGIETEYYYIDYKNKKHTSISGFATMNPYSSFIYDGNLYSVVSTVGLGGSYASLLKYDVTTGSAEKIPHEKNYITHSIQMGLEKENKLFFASNNTMEEPAIWTLDHQNTFTKQLPVDLNDNLGINFVKQVITEFDELYFVNANGLYSMVDSGKLIISFDKKTPLINEETPLVAIYGNKIAVSKHHKDYIMFEVYDVTTGVIDTITKELPGVSSYHKKAGPYIFFNNYEAGGHLYSYNFFTKTFYDYPDLHYPGPIHEGEESAFIEFSKLTTLVSYTTYFFNYNTGEIKKIEKDYDDYTDYFSGHDSSFYICESYNNSVIELYKKNGEKIIIYNGKGSIYRNDSYQKMENSKTTVLVAYENNSCHLIANDLENTEVTTIPHRRNPNGDLFYNQHKNSALLYTELNGIKNYYLYEPFKELTLIESNTDQKFLFSDLQDSLAVLMFYKKDSVIRVVVYDRIFQTYANFELADSDCLFRNTRGGIRIQKNKFVINSSCRTGFELWILDVKEQSIKPMIDLNPESARSYPDKFTRYKDWVYFTAYKNDLNKQWYRIDVEGKISEINFVEKNTLQIYPVPSDNYIQLSGDFVQYSVYNSDGKKVLEGNDYKSGQLVETSFFQPGVYFIIALDKLQKSWSGGFIKF